MRRLTVPALVAAILVTGCAPVVTPTPTVAPTTVPSVAPTTLPTTAPTPSASAALTRDQGWIADIDALLESRERLHPDPWHNIDRATWVAAADAAKARISTIDDDAALVEIVRLAQMPGWGGRDGHTGIFPFIPGSGTHVYPILMWRFSDGLVITAAKAPYEDLVGSRIVAIDRRPIEGILLDVEPLAPRDNPSNLLSYGPLYLRTSELLAGLGYLDAAGPATFTVIGPEADAPMRDVRIEPILADDDVAWHGGDPLTLPPTGAPLWLSRKKDTLWWTYLADSKTLYVQYNEVARGIDGVADEILDRAKRADVDRVVVDLRNNGGGDNNTYRRLRAVLQDPAIDQPGRLALLIGRLTFSAAANFAAELEQTTGATFVGEDMGGSPNLYGDVRPTRLPYGALGPIDVYVATRYWVKSTADDPRITIQPDLAVPYSSADWLAGRDPVLEAAILPR
jgi:hypothetical protein